jgi:hypothetical protein
MVSMSMRIHCVSAVETLARASTIRATSTPALTTAAPATTAPGTSDGVMLADLGHVDGALRRLSEQLHTLQRLAARIAVRVVCACVLF